MFDQSEKISIAVETRYIPQQSSPDQDRFVFSYTVTISNDSAVRCQLLSRHWLIIDANQKQEEVYGEGVIGEQPILDPGESYTYTSGAVLQTDMGTMEGRYFMIASLEDSSDGSADQNASSTVTEFEVVIPKFLLSIPRTIH